MTHVWCLLFLFLWEIAGLHRLLTRAYSSPKDLYNKLEKQTIKEINEIREFFCLKYLPSWGKPKSTVAYSSFLIAVIMPLILFSILILEDYILDCLKSILSTLLSLCFLIIIAYSIRYSLIYLQFSVSSLVHSSADSYYITPKEPLSTCRSAVK